MDPLTHAASGALLAYAIPKHKRPATPFFVVLGALMAASPDIDVVFATTPINYLLLHRGITHSLFAVPFLALLFTFMAYPLWRKKSAPVEDASGETGWNFTKHFAFACICLLLHMWLDVVTTYGTMIFLPFSEYRVRLNGVFIVDILLTLPLLLAVWHGASYRPYAIMALIWLCIYPGSCVALRYYHESRLQLAFTQETAVQEHGRLQNIMVFPDAFAPLRWRVVYATDKPYAGARVTAHTWAQEKSRAGYSFPTSEATVYQRGFYVWGEWTTPLMAYAALHKELAHSLYEQSRRGRAFLDFLVMPVMERKAMTQQDTEQGAEQWGIYDLRFSTLVKAIHELVSMRNDGAPTFLLEAKGSPQQAGQAKQSGQEVRLFLPGAGLDSGWQKPDAPRESSWWERLLGIPY